MGPWKLQITIKEVGTNSQGVILDNSSISFRIEKKMFCPIDKVLFTIKWFLVWRGSAKKKKDEI